MSDRFKEDYKYRGSYSSSVKRRSRSSSDSSSSSSRSRSRSSSNDRQNQSSRDLARRGYRNRSRDKGETSHKDKYQVVTAPPPPKISESTPAAAQSKVSLNLKPSTPGLLKPAGFGKKIGIQMKLNQPAPKEPTKKITVAKAFNNDDSDDNDVEEMPKEARMRMRNIGRETPTSSGPNSFGKTKQGFCDAKKIFEKSLRSLPD